MANSTMLNSLCRVHRWAILITAAAVIATLLQELHLCPQQRRQ
jgi:hypothetical protein